MSFGIMASNPLRLLKITRLPLLVVSIALLAIGVYALQSDLFGDDLFAYLALALGGFYLVMSLIFMPFVIRKIENMQMQRLQREQQ